ncbi:hypothetical protein [Streptomyces sp. NPDC003717]|uniref:hypothetical protein n=1 Tax=Streptomyces sp. NPDC003717 TaxID=3154276 RepID=UPI0033BC68C3
MDVTTSSASKDQAQRVVEEITELIDLLVDADPQQHLETVAELRRTCDHLLTDALVSGMTRARDDGWGLRRIAAHSHYSHEQVRTLLATAPTARTRTS